MKLVVITGPHAVGKMTVGQELAAITDLKLLHNHMTIDLVSDLFINMPEERSRLTALFRREIYEAFAKSDEYGLIITYMWAFDLPSETEYIAGVKTLFEGHGAQTCFVELEADYDLRWQRNTTENRLLNKPTKRDIERSEGLFRRIEAEHRLNSLPGEFPFEPYLRIDNTDLSAREAARMIKDTFQL